jgi:hypothetical protein
VGHFEAAGKLRRVRRDRQQRGTEFFVDLILISVSTFRVLKMYLVDVE